MTKAAVLFFLLALNSTHADAVTLDSLAANYRAAKSDEARFAIAKAAIDAELICQTCPVANIDRVFGTQHASMEAPFKGRDGLFHGTIMFTPGQMGPVDEDTPDAAESARYVGWFLDFSYAEDGSIQAYWLTNLPKLTY